VSGRRGFTLLEVLVAIAILGMGLTVILSSQVGLFSSAQRAQTMTLATNLARCKMSEQEVDLLQKGYPLVESHDEGDCCEDEDSRGFRCEWKVERVELPQPQELSSSGDGGIGDQGGLGALGALASVQQSGGASLGGDAGIGGLASLLSGAAAGGGTQGMAPLVMSLVYPDLKPMLEASIRKVTVSVKWKEGSKERNFDLVQYVTNPQQGGLDPNAAKGLDQLVPEE
jgi:general secretion pathway protein I